MFKALIQGLVVDAIDILDDLNKTFTYRQYLGQVYDPVSGQNVVTFNDIENVKAPFTKFKMDEVDNEVNTLTDTKAVVPALSLPGVTEPSENDVIITSEGERWNVRRLLGVPGESVFLIHVRRVPNV